jgi:hypothetical protein
MCAKENAKLLAEVERLRNALKKISVLDKEPIDLTDLAAAIAQEALELTNPRRGA